MVAVAKGGRKRVTAFSGDRLRSLRENPERPMTQQQLAEAAGVHPVDISKYERGLSEPSFTAASRLAAALGVSMNDLMKPGGQPGD